MGFVVNETEKRTGRAINRLRFKTHIWTAYNRDVKRVWQMVNDVRMFAGLEPMSYDLVKDGMKYCQIYSSDYASALKEFKALCWGDW
jgi:hypothetical protein